MRTRDVTLVSLSLLFVCSCDKQLEFGTGPTAPQSPAAARPVVTQPANTPNWKANATVVSAARGAAVACGWGTTEGDTRADVAWRITTSAGSITLDEDMRNWPTDDVPYTGYVASGQFNGSYTSGGDYANSVCQFREATIAGRFTSDSTFEATETLIWGRPGSETTVTRRWNGSRL